MLKFEFIVNGICLGSRMCNGGVTPFDFPPIDEKITKEVVIGVEFKEVSGGCYGGPSVDIAMPANGGMPVLVGTKK